jgi:hypothetical protein
MHPPVRAPDAPVDLPTSAPRSHPEGSPDDGNAARLALLNALQRAQAGLDAKTNSLWDAFDIGSEFAPLMGSLGDAGGSASVLDPVGGARAGAAEVETRQGVAWANPA